jgi:tRNA(Ile)-lysidine synthase
LYAEVADFMRNHEIPPQGTRILAGVSGGADSLCLLDCLHHLGVDLVVAHLDHMLRADSAQDAEAVRRVCDRYRVPLILGREDVRAQLRRGSSIEATARVVRYTFLGEACLAGGMDCVAVGHTQDDQVETVLLHFLRGAGLEGLSGMAPLTKLGPWLGKGLEGVRLIRPLLGVTREQTREHCARVGLEPLVDATNVDRRYLRNRLRHELIPLLESYNPAFRRSLVRLAEIMAGHREAAEAMTEDAWGRVVLRSDEHGHRLDRARLLEELPAVRRNLLLRALRNVATSEADLGFEAVERVLTWARAGGRRPLQLPAFIAARFENGGIILEDSSQATHARSWPQYAESSPIQVEVPGALALEEGWRLEFREVRTGNPETVTDGVRRDPLTAVFDAEGLPGALEVRSPIAGDRLRPYGMAGSTKLSDVFTNLHVPRRVRRKWPLLSSGAEVLWVCGLRRSARSPVTASSDRILITVLQPPLGTETPLVKMDN